MVVPPCCFESLWIWSVIYCSSVLGPLVQEENKVSNMTQIQHMNLYTVWATIDHIYIYIYMHQYLPPPPMVLVPPSPLWWGYVVRKGEQDVVSV